MNFDELDKLVPWVTGGTKHVLKMEPYENVLLKLPGRHQLDTCPNGGDFVICVTDKNKGWVEHDFTHNDLFADMQEKFLDHDETTKILMKSYANVVNGADPDVQPYVYLPDYPGINYLTFLRAVQCLALAEHRRYPQYEAKGGGRFLPARFSAGIAFGLWTAEDCKAVQRRGRPGVEWLEKEKGKPPTLKELAGV